MRCAPLLDEAMTSGNSATAPRPASVRSPGTTRCTIREGRASSKWRRPRRERLVGRDRAVVRDDRGRGTLPGRKSRSGRRRKDTRTGCARRGWDRRVGPCRCWRRPGEFRNLHSVTVADNDMLLVDDSRLLRVSILGGGDLIRTIALAPFGNPGVLGDRRRFGYGDRTHPGPPVVMRRRPLRIQNGETSSSDCVWHR